MTGTAVRIGQAIGLHRDGASLGLPPFEVEMRRRLWWQIMMLDGSTGELSGSGVCIIAPLWNTKIPLNVNDNDLYPDMQDQPVEHIGPTEMIFFLIRCQTGEFIQQLRSKTPSSGNNTSGYAGSWCSLGESSAESGLKIDRMIDDLESLLEDKFLRYCDPLVPIHFLCSIMARSVIVKVRWVFHHPRQFSDHGACIPQREKDLLFSGSLKMFDYNTLGLANPVIGRFKWHTDVVFQWDALVFMLSELRYRTTGEEVNKAWDQISQIFEYRPQILTETQKPLYVAIGNLTLNAWERAKEYQYSRMGQPEFISKLYAQRNTTTTMQSSNTTQPDIISSRPSDQGSGDKSHASQTESIDTPFISAQGDADLQSQSGPQLLDLSPVDWSQWDDLLLEFETSVSDKTASWV